METNNIPDKSRPLQDGEVLNSGDKYYIQRSDKKIWILATYLCLTVTERYKFFWLGTDNDREYTKSIKIKDIHMIRIPI